MAVCWLGGQGGRLHPLQGVGALVLAAGGGSGGCGHLHGHLVGQAAGGGWHLWVQQVGGGLGHAAGGHGWQRHPLQGGGALVLAAYLGQAAISLSQSGSLGGHQCWLLLLLILLVLVLLHKSDFCSYLPTSFLLSS